MTTEAGRVSLILLDIEGTTTPVSFVTEVLFPYARKYLRAYLEAYRDSDDGKGMLQQLRREYESAREQGDAVPAWAYDTGAEQLTGAAGYLEWLMDRDRKSTALKELQGKIWEHGYARGEIAGQVFSDVPEALRRWRDRHLHVGIFSSGSVLAQQLLFRYSTAGDLTGLIQWHFDTRVGAKGDAESYRRIAQTAGVPAHSVLFLSDVPRELDAARTAGMQVRLVLRPGNIAVDSGSSYPVVRRLDELIAGERSLR